MRRGLKLKFSTDMPGGAISRARLADCTISGAA
jgi:hypothetical protein